MPATPRPSLYCKMPGSMIIPRSIRSGNGGNKYLAKPVFDHFTAEALQAIIIAYDESRRLGHNYVGTEHIMIGLIAQKTDIAAKVFKLMGINLEDTRLEVLKTIGRGNGFFPVEIPFTYRATRVLDHALAEATLLCHDNIGTAHLLLGLIREEDSVAVTVLQRLGIDDLNKIRNQVNRLLSGENTEAVEEKRLSKIEVTINLKYE
ncbi:Atp-dependent clp protease atp-binding subunit clpa-like protein [Thalictrum thalictroides]|uniref:Atp-dependent clp protease atp-binding subunit clpa-like protein n=1 Tax=Thalictrum thalictroides TaxID=46969 RepID=A0A7J6X6L9_THATH|nr:Atp-dependent clp protease atp-binding subunit clpa-like protein [Thalictrum thalictroides]